MDWPEWVDRVASLATLAAFLITLWQVQRAKTAADAAKAAALGVEASLRRNYILILLPQLHRIEVDLEAAIDRQQRPLVQAHLNTWRWQASMVRGFMRDQADLDRAMATAIQASIALAASAKLDVMNDDMDLMVVMRPVQEAVSKVTAKLGELTATYSITYQGERHEQ